MKLREILKQIDEIIPNSLSPSRKVTWINQIQNEFFRDYPVPDSVHTFETDGQDFYALPGDCAEDRIQRLVINKRAYDYAPMVLDTLLGRFWTVVAEQMMIFPTPEKGLQAFLYYRPRPIELSVNDLEVTPTFPNDFIELLVLGCVSRIAKVMDLDKKAQTYDMDFVVLAEKARRSLTKPKQRTVNVTRGWR